MTVSPRRSDSAATPPPEEARPDEPLWKPGVAPLDAIEQDVRRLIREAADARARARRNAEEANARLRELLLDLLGVLDAFDRVFASTAAKPNQVTAQMRVWLGNFRTVRRIAERTLRNHGVRRMEPVDGEPEFNPHFQRATATVEDAAKPEGTVVEEVSPGYLWKNEVLRKAEVAVVRNQAVD